MEPVEDASSVGDGREQPVDVVLVDSLREEGNNSKEIAGIRSKFLEHGRCERKFDGGREALVVLRVKHSCSIFLPFSRQSTVVPPAALGNRSE